jgi:glycosyltransferase involved in cell wall biosynthesis
MIITLNILTNMLDKKKTIMILGALPPPLHGASVYYKNLINNKILHDAFRVYFVNINFGNILSSYQKFALKKVERAFLFLMKYIILFITKKIDLVFAGIAFPKYPFLKDSLFVILAKVFNKRIIGCVLGTGLKCQYQQSSSIMKKYYKFIGNCYTAFVTQGIKMSQTDFHSIFPVERLNFVPFGTNLVIDEKIKIESSIDFYNILYMGNFFSSKGIFDAIKSIKYVTRKHCNVKFIFAGNWMSPGDEEEAKKIINEDMIHDYIEFVGIITQQKKKEILAKSHIFLLPTYYEFEGFPLALLDAMSCGHFIITTDYAAIGEVIKDGINGLFCKKGDPKDLSQKILLAMENKDFFFNVRSKNINEFYEFYTHDKYVKRLVFVLEKYI